MPPVQKSQPHNDHGRGSRQHSKSDTAKEVAAEQHTDHGHRTTRKEKYPKGSSNNYIDRGSTHHSKSNTAKEVAAKQHTDHGHRTTSPLHGPAWRGSIAAESDTPDFWSSSSSYDSAKSSASDSRDLD